MDTPNILLKKADEITAKLEERYPKLAPFFKGCFLNTIETTVSKLDDGGYFVITGDIPAMWLRDSASQLSHYIRYATEDEDLKEIIRSVIARHAQFICLDPYANAFNAVANKNSHKDCERMLMVVKMANRFFTKKKERTTKGRFKPKVMHHCGTSNAISNKILIPAIPPIVKSFGAISAYAAHEMSKEESKVNKMDFTQSIILPFGVFASGLMFSLVILGG